MKTKPKKGIHHASRGTLSNPRSKNDSKRNRKKDVRKSILKNTPRSEQYTKETTIQRKKKEIEKIMLDPLLEFFFFGKRDLKKCLKTKF